MKYMDEWFLMLECGQDSIEYWLHIDKELHLHEDILPLYGFANPSVTFVLVKDLSSFLFPSRLWKFLQKYEWIGSQLSTILVKAGISVNNLQLTWKMQLKEELSIKAKVSLRLKVIFFAGWVCFEPVEEINCQL